MRNIPQICLLIVLIAVAAWLYTTQIAHKPLVTTTATQNSSSTIISGQHDLRGAPTLSAAQVDAILAQHDSPAAGTGYIFYQESVQTGIDDKWPLAFYGHESSYGLAGVARYSKSIGNLRCISGAACVSGYAYFPSWQAGISAWYDLIENLYMPAPPKGFGATTVETIIPHYAPTADHNNEQAYITSVIATVQSWQS